MAGTKNCLSLFSLYYTTNLYLRSLKLSPWLDNPFKDRTGKTLKACPVGLWMQSNQTVLP